MIDKKEAMRLLSNGSDQLCELRSLKVVDFSKYKRIRDAMKRLEKKLVSKGNDLA